MAQTNNCIVIRSKHDATPDIMSEYDCDSKEYITNIVADVNYHKFSDDIYCVDEEYELCDLSICINIRTKMINVSDIIRYCKLSEDLLNQWLLSNEGICALDLVTRYKLNTSLVDYHQSEYAIQTLKRITNYDLCFETIDKLKLDLINISDNNTKFVDTDICEK